MEEKQLQLRKPLQWGEHDPNRARPKVRRWGCGRGCFSVFRRLAILDAADAAQSRCRTSPWIQFLLLLVVTFHAALGIRVILLDFNLEIEH